jgi:hypothetical protein
MDNSKKIILDLCGGTGSWSKPYRDAGYDVKVITIPTNDVRSFKGDFAFHSEGRTEYINPEKVYGILAAPPCTMFSFARTNAKKPRDLQEGMECVRACLDIIWKCMEVQQDTVKKTCPLQFWALENPYHGFLKKFLGKPAFTFDPWEFGDGYQKRTALWGHFNEPKKNPIPMTDKMKGLAKTNSYLHTMKNGTNRGKPPAIWAKKDLMKFDMLASKDIHSEAFGVWDRQARRSITPAGFAKAFYEANK